MVTRVVATLRARGRTFKHANALRSGRDELRCVGVP